MEDASLVVVVEMIDDGDESRVESRVYGVC
jgi:hypothetical protein